ncbi:MAG: hypothetical protein FVQ77_06900 [Cytophagales bacterium]|nr:hypothetical protein [Cytophagales bacterium]
MNINKNQLSTILCVLVLFNEVFAQKSEQIELIQADVLEGGIHNGEEVRKLIGKVVFKHDETFMYCDSSYQYADRNALEAFGHVKIQQGDTLTLTGDTLFYNGDNKMAKVRGNVVLKDKEMTLTTKFLDYDMKNKLAWYYSGGDIIDDENHLFSELGFYNTMSKMLSFKTNVSLINPDYELKSDTLLYNTITKIAYFKGPTDIITGSGTLYAEDGEYYTLEKQSVFRGKARIETEEYILEGDSLYYDEINDIGIAKYNVKLVSKEDNIIIEGDIGKYWGKIGLSKVYGLPKPTSAPEKEKQGIRETEKRKTKQFTDSVRSGGGDLGGAGEVLGYALMKYLMVDPDGNPATGGAGTASDTMYLKADTLISIDDTILENRYLLAYNHVLLFSSDLQGKCDSAVYVFSDSTIFFYNDPVIWNENSQITADSINVQLANNQIDKMNMRINSFIISQDSLLEFNQVKGKNMTAWFKDDLINKVYVDGNGQSIYFVLEEDTSLVGMNKVLCSNMIIMFEENKVKDISFLNNPEAKFIPPHEIEEPEKKLKGFRWRIEDRPRLVDLVP